MPTKPNIAEFTSAPLRNRIRVALTAPIEEVWSLIGDLARFPEYSKGLERVDANVAGSGACTDYVCRFKPQESGGEGLSHREIMRWYEPNRGYASSGEDGNFLAAAFGLENDLNLVTVESARDGTILTWDEYYDARDLPSLRASYDDALADIGENLVNRFGGRILERFVDGPR